MITITDIILIFNYIRYLLYQVVSTMCAYIAIYIVGYIPLLNGYKLKYNSRMRDVAYYYKTADIVTARGICRHLGCTNVDIVFTKGTSIIELSIVDNSVFINNNLVRIPFGDISLKMLEKYITK